MKNQMLIEQVTMSDLQDMISDAIGTEMQKYFTPATKVERPFKLGDYPQA